MTTTIAQFLSTAGAVGLVVAFLGGVVALLERTHRRARRAIRFDRGPLGADLSHDGDLRRSLADLRAAADTHTPLPSTGSRRTGAPATHTNRVRAA